MPSQKITIDRVNRGPEPGREYDSKYGKVYPVEYLCDVTDGGKSIRDAKVSIPAQKEGKHILEEHITPGTTIATWEPKDYKGQQQYTVVVKETKALLGLDAYKGGGSGGNTGGNMVGTEVGAAMHDAAVLLGRDCRSLSDDELKAEMLRLARIMLSVSGELKAERSQASQDAPQGASSPNPTHDDRDAIRAVLKADKALANAVGLLPDALGTCQKCWDDARGDENRFKELLMDVIDGASADGLPF